jgi:hypothetical protein
VRRWSRRRSIYPVSRGNDWRGEPFQSVPPTPLHFRAPWGPVGADDGATELDALVLLGGGVIVENVVEAHSTKRVPPALVVVWMPNMVSPHVQ